MILLPVAETASAQSPIERYVTEGLAANPGLISAAGRVAGANASATEASRAYLPSLELQARYTRAGGGRTIEFPVGDLLNPAYGALNDLTGASTFPTIENESFRLLRSREQDTRIQLYQPVYEPAIGPGIRATRAQADAERFSLDTFRRDLAARIRSGYLGYLQAAEAVAIHDAAVELVDEALRVSERLVENGLATGDAVYRAQAELAAVRQDLASAQTTRNLAAASFNTLLARPIDAQIEPMSVEELENALDADRTLASTEETGSHAELTSRALVERSELKQIDASLRVAGAQVDFARSAFRPSVGVALDAGIQGSAYTIDSEESFRTASVVMRWNLFDGRRRGLRVEQARIAERALESTRHDASNQIELEVRQAVWQADLEARNVLVAERQLSSARNAHRLTARRYEEGMATLLDLLDARTSLTAATLSLTINRFNTLQREVELARVAELEFQP